MKFQQEESYSPMPSRNKHPTIKNFWKSWQKFGMSMPKSSVPFQCLREKHQIILSKSQPLPPSNMNHCGGTWSSVNSWAKKGSLRRCGRTRDDDGFKGIWRYSMYRNIHQSNSIWGSNPRLILSIWLTLDLIWSFMIPSISQSFYSWKNRWYFGLLDAIHY